MHISIPTEIANKDPDVAEFYAMKKRISEIYASKEEKTMLRALDRMDSTFALEFLCKLVELQRQWLRVTVSRLTEELNQTDTVTFR